MPEEFVYDNDGNELPAYRDLGDLADEIYERERDRRLMDEDPPFDTEDAIEHMNVNYLKKIKNMKALLITSTEYYGNKPAVFAIIDGKYYGDMSYPTLRNFPDNEYWKHATCADSDRYFNTIDVCYSTEIVDQIKALQNVMIYNSRMLKDYPHWEKAPDYKIRRGQAYEAYKIFTEKEAREIDKVTKYNAPYYVAIDAAYNELRELLLSAL